MEWRIVNKKVYSGRGIMKNLLVRFLFHLLDFNQMKEITVTREEREAFDSLFHGECLCAEGNSMNDSLTYPKYKFLQYIVEHKNVLIHGTSNRNIKRFEPRRQSLFNGEMVCAVFAASDGIWPMFFAIINREQYKGSLRNMCLSVPTKKGIRRYYYFSLVIPFKVIHFTKVRSIFCRKKDLNRVVSGMNGFVKEK